MAHSFAIRALVSLAALTSAHAYFLVGVRNFLTTERIDPIVNVGTVSTHVHSVMGGSNFRVSTNTSFLRQSECTSMPIKEDKSAYWFPTLYFQCMEEWFLQFRRRWLCHVYVWHRVIRHRRPNVALDYLFDGKAGVTTAFPDDFRMISGDPMLRTYDENSKAQKAITFLCLDFNGVTTRHNELPAKSCPSGIRSQVNFPMCWDGKNTDSADHKSHVAFPSGGPDSGDCSDPNFPVRMPRIFNEIYWDTGSWEAHRNDAMKPDQPFVFSHGDRTGYGYHGDFINGWDAGVLQKVVDNCYCNDFGDASCCAQKGLFTLNTDGHCRITRSINEITTGTLPKLPGNNPVQEEGHRATMFADDTHPGFLSPALQYPADPDQETTQLLLPSPRPLLQKLQVLPRPFLQRPTATTTASSDDSAQTQSSVEAGPTSTPPSGPYGGSGTSIASTEESTQTQGSEGTTPVTNPGSGNGPASGPYGTSEESSNGANNGANNGSNGNVDTSNSGGHVYGTTGSSNNSGNGSDGASGSQNTSGSSKTCHRRSNKRGRSLKKARHFHDSTKRFTNNLF
ncbi:hypothetical protein VNI00_010735 [Paramarasmius palmivorus]|uniref:DUF1996 domain-containing protein n=1 Tax=Paramarasmius palmivorus TaxID=297713 RepID=A0AAW0CFC3_9AGAR